MKNEELKGGLIFAPKDERNFSHAQVFGTVSLPEIDFVNAYPFQIKSQKDTDFCTGYSVSSASSAQEGVDLSPEFQFWATKKISGKPDEYGATIYDALKSAVKYGSISQSSALKVIRDRYDRGEVLNASYGQDLLAEGLSHAKASYFEADGYGNTFDNIRGTLWLNRLSQATIITGAYWRPEWTNAPNGIIPKKYKTTSTFGHCFLIRGQKKINGEWYLIAEAWVGEEKGDKGFYYFPREVVNKEFTFGEFVLKDMAREKAEWYIINNIKVSDNWLQSMIKQVSTALFDLVNMLFKTEHPVDIPKDDIIKPMEKILKFCKAIEIHEGYFQGSRSFRNKSPGNLKYVGQANTTGKDDKGFAIFKTYEDGFNALKDMVIRACEGRSKVYKAEMSILKFFQIFAPSNDNNNPEQYARFVATQCGIPTSTPIKNLLA